MNPATCGVGHGLESAEQRREAHKSLRVCGRRLKRELAGHKRRTKEVALLVRGSSDEDSVFETGARAADESKRLKNGDENEQEPEGAGRSAHGRLHSGVDDDL